MNTTDTPFHRLSRTERHRWFKPLLEIVLAAFLFVVFITIAGEVLPRIVGVRWADLDHHGGIGALMMVGVLLATGIPAARLAARAFGRRPGTLSSVAGRLRWPLLGRCVLIALAVYGTALVIALAIGAFATDESILDTWAGWRAFLPFAAGILLVIPLQAAGEEYLFRGTLLQAIGALGAPAWVAITVSGLLFGAMHGLTPQLLVALGGFGIIMGWLSVRTGGIEAAIAMHVVSNTTSFALVAAFSGVGVRMSDINAGVSWWGVGINLAVDIACAALLARAASRPGSRARTRFSHTDTPTPTPAAAAA